MSSLTEWRPLCLPAVLHFCFHNCAPPPSWKKGACFYPACITIWPFCDPASTATTASGCGRNRVTFVFDQSEFSAATDWRVERRRQATPINIAEKQNAASLLICEICQCFTFHESYYFTEQRKLRPAALALHFLNLRLCSVTTHCNSYCLQVTGGPGRWIQVPNELTLCSS